MNISMKNAESTSNEVLGMGPANLLAGTPGVSAKYFAIGACSLGSILVARSERGICAILLGDAPVLLVRDLQNRFPRTDLMGGDGECEQLVAKVAGFIER